MSFRSASRICWQFGLGISGKMAHLREVWSAMCYGLTLYFYHSPCGSCESESLPTCVFFARRFASRKEGIEEQICRTLSQRYWGGGGLRRSGRTLKTSVYLHYITTFVIVLRVIWCSDTSPLFNSFPDASWVPRRAFERRGRGWSESWGRGRRIQCTQGRSLPHSGKIDANWAEFNAADPLLKDYVESFHMNFLSVLPKLDDTLLQIRCMARDRNKGPITRNPW